jgi:nicotinamide-nucleotide amidase
MTSSARPIRNAVLLAVGSELTTGETRDTNSGDLARKLSQAGVTVAWISALPDELNTAVRAIEGALAVADLVVTTGGLGPTPDDLTREAISAVFGEKPSVDPELERWLRHLFERRGLPFHDTNIKQAWLIPSAQPIPNDRGTAPGWWVERPDGRVVVALPGPPREMTAMWENGVVPRLLSRGLGEERVTRTYRLTGIGESAVAAALGEPLLRATNPVVATYARADAVDVRITAVAQGSRPPAELVEEAAAAVLAAVGKNVWGHDDDTWPVAIARALAPLGWSVALVEIGTGGTAAALLGDAVWLRSARIFSDAGSSSSLLETAESARAESASDVGLAVRAVESGEDTSVELAAAGPFRSTELRQVAFLGGAEGRRRAGISAAAFLFRIAQEASKVAE